MRSPSGTSAVARMAGHGRTDEPMERREGGQLCQYEKLIRWYRSNSLVIPMYREAEA